MVGSDPLESESDVTLMIITLFQFITVGFIFGTVTKIKIVSQIDTKLWEIS